MSKASGDMVIGGAVNGEGSLTVEVQKTGKDSYLSQVINLVKEAQADVVGIAIGAGTDVAVETADIVLVRSNPLDATSVVELAKGTYGKMVQNLIWTTGYKAVAIPLAAGVLYGYAVLLSPAIGAVLMSLSTVIVAVNVRLLKVPEGIGGEEER